jgi:phage terminase small subunit
MAARKKPAAKAPARKPAAKVKPSKNRPRNATKLGHGKADDRDADGCLISEAKFVLEYLKDSNGTQAAIRAGYSPRTATEQACQIFARPHVKAAIERRRAAMMENMAVSTERVLLEFARIAFFDIRKLYDENGRLKAISELDADTAAALASVETIGLITDKVTAHRKHSALDALAKHLGLFKEDNRQKGDAIAALLQEVGSRDSGLPVKS